MTTHVHPGAGEKAGTREWIGLAVLALPTLLVSIDVSVLLLALPHLAVALKADSAQMLWIMDIYGFMLAGFMITMGTLGDRIGRRKILMVGAAAFTAASILAAFSPTPEVLILARALLGIAGATLSPSIMALLTNMFRDPAQRGFAISVWFTCFMSGMTIGPLVGGFMLEHFWWGSVFLLGVPVMVLLLVVAPILLPEYRDKSAGRIDLPSVALSLLTILPFVYGLKEIAKHGPDVMSLSAIAVGLLFGMVFVARQRRLEDPLLDLKLFSNRAFSTAVGGMFLITSTGALMLFTNQYLQLVLGLSPLETGLWSLPGILASVASFMLSPIVAKTVRPAPLIATGLVVAACGALLMTMTGTSSGLAALLVGFTIFNIGCGPMVTLSSGIVLSSVQPEKAGSAAALSETFSEFGFALGIAAFGSLVTALYRTNIAPAIPAHLPALEAEAVRDTLAGAIASAAALPNTVGEPLALAAKQAFLGGFHLVSLICVGTLLAVALLTLVMFRHLPAFRDAPETEANEMKVTA